MIKSGCMVIYHVTKDLYDRICDVLLNYRLKNPEIMFYALRLPKSIKQHSCFKQY